MSLASGCSAHACRLCSPCDYMDAASMARYSSAVATRGLVLWRWSASAPLITSSNIALGHPMAARPWAGPGGIHGADGFGNVSRAGQAHGMGHAFEAPVFCTDSAPALKRITAGRNMALSVPWCRRG